MTDAIKRFAYVKHYLSGYLFKNIQCLFIIKFHYNEDNYNVLEDFWHCNMMIAYMLLLTPPVNSIYNHQITINATDFQIQHYYFDCTID